MFHSHEDKLLQLYLILHPNHGKQATHGAHTVSLQFQAEQEVLLETMHKFVYSNKCRRLEILQYLGAKEDEHQGLLINHECCDNCHKILNDEIPIISPNLLYEGIRDDSTLDLSIELRSLLLSINSNLKMTDSLSLLTGQIPNHGIHCDISIFGLGRSHDLDWWQGFVMLVESSGFLIISEQQPKVSKKGKKFLRNKLQKADLKPNRLMKKSIPKRKDLVYYWEGNEVKARPANQQNKICPINEAICTQKEMEIIQQTLDFDMSEFDDNDELVGTEVLSANDKRTLEQTLEGLDDEFFEDYESSAKIQKLN